MATIAEAAKIGLKRGGGGASEAVASQVVKAAGDNNAISRIKGQEILRQKIQNNNFNLNNAAFDPKPQKTIFSSNSELARKLGVPEVQTRGYELPGNKLIKELASSTSNEVSNELDKISQRVNSRKQSFKNKKFNFKKNAAFDPKPQQTIFSSNSEISRKLGKPGVQSKGYELPSDKHIKEFADSFNNEYSNRVKDPLDKIKPRKKTDDFATIVKKDKEKKQDQILTAKAHRTLNKFDDAELDGGLRGAWTTVKSLGGGASDFYLDPVEGAGRRKAAYKGTFQAAAVSAAGHAGVAVLNGDDPWEAAKTGAFRGALAGGGYQTLKGATGANTGSMWGNMQHIGSTTKDMYRATTIKGRESIRAGEEKMSRPLKKMLSAQVDAKTSSAVRNKKGNTTTAQVMNQG